jgi:negative regulator of flagellin synthesis FlgM
MAIDRIQGPGAPKPPETVQGANRAATRKSADTPAPRQDDRIELSGEARLAAKAGELPDVRVEKVERLRETIQEGTYAVDPRAVARAIVEFEGDLFGR